MENSAPVNRTYQQKTWVRAFGIFSVFFVAILGIVFWKLPLPAGEELLMMTFVALPLFIGIGVMLNSIKARICFTADAVELHTLLAKKSLPLSAIRGRREAVIEWREEGSTRYLLLIPFDEKLPTLRFIKSYNFDDAFYDWFNALPDLDAEDKKLKRAEASASSD